MIELNENFKWVGGENIDARHRAKMVEDIADTCRVGEIGRVLRNSSALIGYCASGCKHTKLSTTTVHSSTDSRRIGTVGGCTTRFGIISSYHQPGHVRCTNYTLLDPKCLASRWTRAQETSILNPPCQVPFMARIVSTASW